jgi:glutathione-specific gamma-glutamylcyclotransferase
MPLQTPSPRLTADLVRQVERTEPDPGPEDGTVDHTAKDFDAMASALLSEYSPKTLWVFAYGSLIWNPAFDVEQTEPAVAQNWHRSFCLTLTRWRGTREMPALMLALAEGGSCQGLAYALPKQDHKSQIVRLLEREIDANPPTNIARWIDVTTAQGPLKALTFVADPKGPAYAGHHSVQQVAWILARAAGHWGSCAQYLYNTFTMLEAQGIHDPYIWEIQELVAQEILTLGANS